MISGFLTDTGPPVLRIKTVQELGSKYQARRFGHPNSKELNYIYFLFYFVYIFAPGGVKLPLRIMVYILPFLLCEKWM